jgi:hypothetical protein
MGRYRKGFARTAGVAAAVTLDGNPVITFEPIAPIMAVSADAIPFTTQRATDIRFGVGIFI